MDKRTEMIENLMKEQEELFFKQNNIKMNRHQRNHLKSIVEKQVDRYLKKLNS